MEQKCDGGKAFPGYDLYGDGKQHFSWHPHGGMSLRDYFAAKVMQGLVVLCNQETTWEQDAKRAYEIADEMLAARQKA